MKFVVLSVAAAAFAVGLCGCGGGGGHSGSPGVKPDLAFARSAGGSGATWGAAVASFPDDSFVVLGQLDGSATFGFGEAHETVLTSTGPSDVALARYDAAGHLVWAKRAGGPASYFVGRGLAVLSDGTIVVDGYFDGTITFGPGEANETVLGSTGEDGWLAHYAADGSLLQAFAVGGAGGQELLTVAAVPTGGYVVGGDFDGTLTLDGPSPIVLTSTGWFEGFVARYQADGTLVSAGQSESGPTDYAIVWGVTVLPDGSVGVAAAYHGQTTLGAGEANETTFVAAGSGDVAVARYAPAGTLLWARTAGGTDSDTIRGIAAASDGSVRAVGTFYGDATFGGESGSPVVLSSGQTAEGTSGEDVFVVSYSLAGAFQWASQSVGTGLQGGCMGLSIACFADGGCAVAGSYASTVTFGVGEVAETIVSTDGPGDHDSFVARFQPNGLLDWVSVSGGADADYAFGCSVLSDGGCLSTGSFETSAVFGAGDPNQTTLTDAGAGGLFVCRCNANGHM